MVGVFADPKRSLCCAFSLGWITDNYFSQLCVSFSRGPPPKKNTGLPFGFLVKTRKHGLPTPKNRPNGWFTPSGPLKDQISGRTNPSSPKGLDRAHPITEATCFGVLHAVFKTRPNNCCFPCPKSQLSNMQWLDDPGAAHVCSFGFYWFSPFGRQGQDSMWVCSFFGRLPQTNVLSSFWFHF